MSERTGMSALTGRRPGTGWLLLPLLALAASACQRVEPAPLGRVAFVRGDTLYVQSLPDGKARALTVGRGLAGPRWSPSGAWIAFRRNDSLRLERSYGAIGGGGQTLAGPDATAYAWAPGDDRLAYVGGGNLIVARAGGMAVVLVERTRNAEAEGVAWSPDGAWLAVGTRPPAGAAATARPGLWRVPARGGSAQAIPLPPVPFVGAPLIRGWTADGTRILVLLPAGDLRTGTVASGGAPLWAIQADGGTPARWADSVLPYPDFVSRGGAGVAFVAGGGDATWRDKAIVVALPHARGLRRLTPAGQAAIAPSWAPDGQRLAWVMMPELPLAGGEDASPRLQQRRIVLADIASGAHGWLGGPAGRQEMPRLTADGRHVLLAAIDSGGNAALWLVAEKEVPRRVVAPLEPLGPTPAAAWSGLYGHIAWDELVDYWPGPPPRRKAP